MKPEQERFLRATSWVISTILVVVIVFKLFHYYSGSHNTNGQPLNNAITQNENDITWGDPNAPLTIYMYSSYKCKFCSLFFKKVFPQLKKEYIDQGQLRIVLKLINLREEKPLMRAIQASVCVNKFGDFEKLHNLLITNYKIAYTQDFQVLLDDFIGANVDIAQCMLENNDYQYIKNNNAEFRNHNFSGTPTFVIQNKAYSGFRTFEQFQKILK